MKTYYDIYFNNGNVVNVKADKVVKNPDSKCDLIFTDLINNVIAEFNSEHIAGYSIRKEWS